jgi:hypothetical protein
MTSSSGHGVVDVRARLTDEAYIAWRSAESECEQCLRAWFEARATVRRSAFFAYQAALEREEAAARDLELLHAPTQPYRAQLARPVEDAPL